ncbi:MAG: Pantothenate synthetase [Gammaproteobacteria bacterium]|nr:Pantothenate synthetase [Gammaproteobacteria bacterium]
MRPVEDIDELHAALASWRRAGDTIALVPTMGNLHAGHLALVRRARALASRTVVSIFVNPMQFVEGEDFDRYPRTPEADQRMLAEAGVDAAFMPSAAQMYPNGYADTTRVHVPGLESIYCGAFRPGHFTGVATVVVKLFNLVRPDFAIFGDKDFQQLMLVRRMAADLRFPIEIIGVPTVRDADGLALSSRNNYLSAEERGRAPRLYEILSGLAAKLEAGSTDYAALQAEAMSGLSAAGFVPQYVAICRHADLQPPRSADRELVILAAAWLGNSRLIDHIEVRAG